MFLEISLILYHRFVTGELFGCHLPRLAASSHLKMLFGCVLAISDGPENYPRKEAKPLEYSFVQSSE